MDGIRIQILGIGCKKSRALKANLSEALARTGVKAEVEEIREVNRIIAAQVLSTPALLINRELHYQGVVPEVDELSRLLRNISTTPTQSILLPIDLSPNSANALQYGAELATQWQANLNILHIYHHDNDPDNLFNDRDTADLALQKEQKLRQFLEKFCEQSPDLAQTIRFGTAVIKMGIPVEEIIRESQHCRLLILSCRKEKLPLESIFGNIASEIVFSAHCPVLLVPERAPFKKFAKIILAVDKAGPKSEKWRQLKKTLGLSDPEISLVHVEQREGVEYLVSGSKKLPGIAKVPQVPTPNAQVIFAENILGGLSRFAQETNADLIVMYTRERSFMCRMLSPGLTQKMMQNLSFPLLIFQNA